METAYLLVAVKVFAVGKSDSLQKNTSVSVQQRVAAESSVGEADDLAIQLRVLRT